MAAVNGSTGTSVWFVPILYNPVTWGGFWFQGGQPMPLGTQIRLIALPVKRPRLCQDPLETMEQWQTTAQETAQPVHHFDSQHTDHASWPTQARAEGAELACQESQRPLEYWQRPSAGSSELTQMFGGHHQLSHCSKSTGSVTEM